MFIYIEFNMGETALFHTRKIYDVLTLLGDVGAVVGVFETVFLLLMAPMAQHLFLIKAIQKMFLAKTSKEHLFDDGNIMKLRKK